MPVRVKPIHDLGPCSLDMDSIKGICALVDKTFHYALYSATDGIWEIYNEESDVFLGAIADRIKLDSFTVAAPSSTAYSKAQEVAAIVSGPAIPEFDKDRKTQLVFDSKVANAIFDVSPSHIEWVEHFMLDLVKNIHRPLPGQFFGRVYPITLSLNSVAIMAQLATSFMSKSEKVFIGTYTKIILRKRERNPSAISIRDNLTANLIYDVAKVLLGVIIALLVVWIYNRYGVNISEWFSTPSIPTATP